MPGAPQTFKSDAELSAFLDQNKRQITAVHFSAHWSDPCVQINTEVIPALAQEYPKIKFVIAEAESVPSTAAEFKVTSVPTFVFLRAGKVLETIEGAHVAQVNKRSKFYATIADFPPPPEPSARKPPSIEERIKALLNKAPVMLFMKGNPIEPKCGFSRQIVDILRKYDVQYLHFDILTDEDIRQGLKTYSNWPTYPQLYVNGQLIGGLDIVKELDASGEFAEQLPKKENLNDRLNRLTKQSKIMVFMKGSPTWPKCGFSRTLVSILDEMGIKYGHFDILSDEEVRQGLKSYSNWPTYPQLYKNGELLGGLDIVKEMKESNELVDALK